MEEPVGRKTHEVGLGNLQDVLDEVDVREGLADVDPGLETALEIQFARAFGERHSDAVLAVAANTGACQSSDGGWAVPESSHFQGLSGQDARLV